MSREKLEEFLFLKVARLPVVFSPPLVGFSILLDNIDRYLVQIAWLSFVIVSIQINSEVMKPVLLKK